MKCDKVRDKIVARRSDWLKPREAAEFDEHVAHCAECRRQVDADLRLCEALDGVASVSVTTPTWSQVRAAHAPARRPFARWILAPAIGAAAASTALLWIAVYGPRSGDLPIAGASRDSQITTARQAHMMMAASDASGDPNRAIVAWYLGSEER